jgi:hypothetical protein
MPELLGDIDSEDDTVTDGHPISRICGTMRKRLIVPPGKAKY